MRLDTSRVTGDHEGEAPWIRVEANRPYVIATTTATMAALVFVIWVTLFSELPLLLVYGSVVFVLSGLLFLTRIGPARLLFRPWISAGEHGIAARKVLEVVRYDWDQVISVTWSRMSLFLWIGALTIVEVTPKLRDPESPYGPINPNEITLWFLGNKKRSSEIGHEFLSVCRHYGAQTRLVAGAEREG